MLQSAAMWCRRIWLCQQCLGPARGSALAIAEQFPQATGRRVHARGFGHGPVLLRAGTSDLEVYRQVITLREYDFALDSSPRVIVDAGAHIGLAALWFASQYPDTIIVALEPEARNFDLLVANTAQYPNIKPIRAALWGTNSDVNVVDPGDGTWGFRVAAKSTDAGERVRGVTVADLMREFEFDHIDLLKVDIEGAEIEVFSDCESWIQHVDRVVVELHDRIRPGCSRAFFDAVRDFGDERWQGENVLVARTRRAPAPAF